MPSSSDPGTEKGGGSEPVSLLWTLGLFLRQHFRISTYYTPPSWSEACIQLSSEQSLSARVLPGTAELHESTLITFISINPRLDLAGPIFSGGLLLHLSKLSP